MLKKKDKKDKKVQNRCGIVTCLHYIDGKCNLEKCEFYERYLCQED